MESYYKNSIIYHLLNKISVYYNESMLHKLFVTIGFWYKNSVLCRICTSYIEKKSTAKSTLSYRILSLIARKLDIRAEKIHDFYARYVESSISFRFYGSLKSESVKSINHILGTVLLTFAAGYSMATSVHGQWNSHKALYAVIPFVAGILLFSFNVNWKQWLKGSAFYRAFLYIFE